MIATSLPGRSAARRADPASIFETIFDGSHVEARFFAALAVLLVLVRAAAMTLVASISFDSEQAIIGLMAKHLSEFRTFPLFTYGQNYQLAVESWLIAPLFWIFRPTVAVMRIPLVILNAAVALMLMRAVSTALGARPAIGFIAALPFIMPTPLMGITLTEDTGSPIEPLLYVLLLWTLRRRPFAFGALLAFGFLHREFTMYAVPALLLVEIAGGSFWTAGTARRAAIAAAGFILVSLIIDDAKLHLSGTSLLAQAQMLGADACFQASDYVARIRYEFVRVLPALAGGVATPLHEFGKRSPVVAGSRIVGWAVGGAMALMLVRLAWLWRLKRDQGDSAIGMYLMVIGGCAIVAYPLACRAAVNADPTPRYLTMAMLLPTGCFAAFMLFERSRYLKSVVVSVFLLWGAANLVDNVRVLYATYADPEPDPRQELTDFLLSHQIRYGRAAFWDAYEVDFLSRERIILGSFIPVRIPEYERLVDENHDTAVNVVRTPCEGQVRFSAWCIQLPAR